MAYYTFCIKLAHPKRDNQEMAIVANKKVVLTLKISEFHLSSIKITALIETYIFIISYQESHLRVNLIKTMNTIKVFCKSSTKFFKTALRNSRNLYREQLGR